MCDYSLTNVKSRPAAVGDKLIVHSFGTGTSGFADLADAEFAKTAVCLMPGTEIAFDAPIQAWPPGDEVCSVAIFRQINKEVPNTHHDVIETNSGKQVLLTSLTTGQKATVLQLPATPKTKAEAAEQTRAAYAEHALSDTY